jgi:hypothetical protein
VTDPAGIVRLRRTGLTQDGDAEELLADWDAMVAALRPFAEYAHVLELIAGEDRSIGSTNGWSNLDPVLGGRGQIVTMGHFRKAAKVYAKMTTKEEAPCPK